MRRLLLLLMTPVLMAATCTGTSNQCDKPPVPGVGAVLPVTTAQALFEADPCRDKPDALILAWYTQAGVRYPLRCGRIDQPLRNGKMGGGFGYRHITGDPAADGTIGHGDPVNDKGFSAEIQYTLDHGKEALQGGGTWRYTVQYDPSQAACFNGWGFRVLLAKSPPEPDGYPAGIITAFMYTQPPANFP